MYATTKPRSPRGLPMPGPAAPGEAARNWGQTEPFTPQSGVCTMTKASEYRQHAEECRNLAKGLAPGDQRDQLLKMAATWDKLASDRSELVRRHPELALRGEHDEEVAAAAPSRNDRAAG